MTERNMSSDEIIDELEIIKALIEKGKDHSAYIRLSNLYLKGKNDGITLMADKIIQGRK